MEEMLHSTPATIVLGEIVPVLRAHGFFSLLIDIYRQSNDEEKLLHTWSKLVSTPHSGCLFDSYIQSFTLNRIVEGEWKDPSVTNPLGEIIQLLSTSRNRDIVQRYGLWLARQEPVAAFSVRFLTDASRSKVEQASLTTIYS